MKLLTLSCQQCGAPLEVPAKITQLTCQFCGARLQVQRTGSAAYTEVLDEVADRVERVAETTEQIRIEQEIARLDRDWQLDRERFMIRGKDGEIRVPEKTPLVIGGVIVVVFGIFWTLFAGGIATLIGGGIHGAGGGPLSMLPGFFPCFGLLFIAVALFGTISAFRKADDFARHQQQYHAERSKLLGELEKTSRDGKR